MSGMPLGDAERPLVSVVVEGYNELRLATSVTDVLDGLAAQDYPLDRVELILVGDATQYRDWKEIASEERRFHRVLTVEAEGRLYYELKNIGAARASGEIVAFVDSDVHPLPGWLSAIVCAISHGADVTSGLSSFWNRSRWGVPRALLDAAASVSFGHVVGRGEGTGSIGAGGIVAHNLAGRTDVLHSTPFRTERLGRNCSVALLYEDLVSAGRRVALVPRQRVEHSFSPSWFVYPFHVRVGWEEHALRRSTPAARTHFFRRTGPVEPLLTALLCICLDLRTWSRYSRARGWGLPRRLVMWPLVLIPSIVARCAGLVGGYAAMLAPRRAREWAEAQ